MDYMDFQKISTLVLKTNYPLSIFERNVEITSVPPVLALNSIITGDGEYGVKDVGEITGYFRDLSSPFSGSLLRSGIPSSYLSSLHQPRKPPKRCIWAI